MNKEILSKISPEVLTQFVSFDRDNKNWQYDPSQRRTMQSKQAEGAAYLFNLLNNERIALLADEVGMGKTIQALSVMSALWVQKPDAKILILAPRYEIAKNWENEYGTFINVHYKLNDDKVKTRFGNNEINPAFYCNNLYDLVNQYSEIGKKLFIGKISSFSSLFSKEEVNERMNSVGIDTEVNNYNLGEETSKTEQAYRIGKALRERLYNLANSNPTKVSKQPPFDLLIIDEAHYFRNKDGDSIRAHAAQSFFGTNDTNKIADRVLMLTATPNHTSSKNINAIFSYFQKDLEKVDFQTLLDKYSIRRYRRLTDKGFMKYNYREEVPVSATFDNNPLSELFFGLYQKKLAKAYMEEGNQGRKNRMLNFLEGTEFIPKLVKDEENIDVNDNRSTDFESGADRTILAEISESYNSLFHEYPSHPKYDILINNLIPENFELIDLNQKNLVFVRRIPSVREIAGRVNLEYDKLLFEKITIALGIKKSKINLANFNRRDFIRLIDRELGTDPEIEGKNDDEEENNENNSTGNIGYYSSKVLDFFKVIKTEKASNRSTPASNFRLRFTKSKPGLFPVFFAPGSDYFNEAYKISEIKRTKYSNDKTDDNFYVTCLNIRTCNIIEHDSIKLNKLLKGKSSEQDINTVDTFTLETLLTVFWKHLQVNGNPEYSDLVKKYNSFSPYEKEAFSKFLEKGILLASSGVVELFAVFLHVQRKNPTKNRIKLYQNFISHLEKIFPDTVLPDLIIKSIRSFKLIVEKVFNIRNNEDLVNYNWKDFFDAQPAYPYWGDTKNERVISSFNTPFFPNVLISTSVLQEGVNLQYFCKDIVHYGIAWTPGDNEQRVGRIDRMFGQIENELKLSDNATLRICYPYLKGTIDQDHVIDFIYKKYSEEERIDRCYSSSEGKKLSYEDLNTENWSNFFRIPLKDKMEDRDPYPVKLEVFKDIEIFKIDSNLKVDIKKQIVQTLRDNKLKIYNPSNNHFNSNEICIVDEKLVDEGITRSQPIFMEIQYNPIITGIANELIYILVLKTPLGIKGKLNSYIRNYEKFSVFYNRHYLNTKICIDENQSRESAFYFYMKTELPLFPENGFNDLSQYEIIENIKKLSECADLVEKTTFGNTQDINLNDLNINSKILEIEKEHYSLRDMFERENISDKWGFNKDYTFIEEKFRLQPKLEILWHENHNRPFVRYIFEKTNVFQQIAFLNNDIQLKESELLEKVFEYYAKA